MNKFLIVFRKSFEFFESNFIYGISIIASYHFILQQSRVPQLENFLI